MKKKEIEKYIEMIERATEKAGNTMEYAEAIGAIKAIIEEFNEKLCEKNPNKQMATKNAHNANKRKSEEKIMNAINMLELEGKKVTYYAIAQVAGISYNTVKARIEDNQSLSDRFNMFNKVKEEQRYTKLF